MKYSINVKKLSTKNRFIDCLKQSALQSLYKYALIRVRVSKKIDVYSIQFERSKKMDGNILLVLVKTFNSDIEKTTIYKDGKVETEISKNEIKNNQCTHIDIANDIEKKLQEAEEILNIMCTEKKDDRYRVIYNNQTYYSFDLFLDIHLMIKHNQIKNLAVLSQYEKQKETKQKDKESKNNKKVLDEMEKNKKEIEIENVVEKDLKNEERKIISFQLEETNKFSLGQSRFFSNTVDIADSIEIPELLEFVGQLNLSEFAQYDSKNLLPKNGMLYFFQSPLFYEGNSYNFGKVIYSNNMDLKSKQVKNNYSGDFLNLAVTNITSSSEKFGTRYKEEEGTLEYDPFEGDNINKIYGFYTDCQMMEEEIIKVSEKYIVLLQLGSDIYGEGTTTFLITEEDLKNNNFDNIIYQYVQS